MRPGPVKILWQATEVDPALRGGALAIGNFDGVHLGHQRILERLREAAAERGVPTVAVTFEPHPLELLSPQTAPSRLTPEPIKVGLLHECGIDAVVVLSIDRAFLSLGAEAFFQQIVVGLFHASVLVEGDDFRFGRGRAGGVDMLTRLGGPHGIAVQAVPHVTVDTGEVSSSAIRSLLGRGHAADAAALLGRPHRLVGPVVRGKGRGRDLGFPTANLDPVAGMLPAEGIYAGRARIAQTTWPAAVSIGAKPTFGDPQVGVEAHVVGYNEQELYGHELCLELLQYLRGIETFSCSAKLVRQMQHDVDQTRRIVQKHATEAHVPLGLDETQ